MANKKAKSKQNRRDRRKAKASRWRREGTKKAKVKGYHHGKEQ